MDWISSNSYWHVTADAAPADGSATPQREESFDVVIVGAGITGLTTSIHLQNAGLSVAIIEAGRVGAGTTGGTTGHLDAHPDQGAPKLIEQFDEESARLVTQARMAAIDDIQRWCEEFAIPCDFQRVPAYWYSESSEAAGSFRKECDALRRLGLTADFVDTTGLPYASPCAVRIENQGRFHSLNYLKGLNERFRRGGGAVYEHVRAAPPQSGDRLETSAATFYAARGVVLTTHSAFLGLTPLDLRIAPYQSYVLTARVREAIPDALFWDDASPYHYLRRASSTDPDLVMIGGCDHKTGQGDDERDAMASLEKFARDRFRIERIEQRWSAELFEPADGLPYIGEMPQIEHLYVAAAFSGTGLTFGAMAGRLLAQLILGESPPLANILTPARVKPLAAGRRVISENLNVAKRFVSDRFTMESIRSLDEIPVGAGRLVRYRGTALALFRDDEGTLHALSPACRHTGCFVQWNEQERTWDCPCHGGRYASTGERIYGPPAKNLEVRTASLE